VIPSHRASSSRTLLLFVIRDHIATPLENLRSTLSADLGKIWDSLSKPPDLAEAKLSDYFDLAFTALPHKLLAAQKFEQEVAKLRTRFVDPNDQGYVFKPAYHKRIPADGVAFYMESIWVRPRASCRFIWSDDEHGDRLRFRNKFSRTRISTCPLNKNSSLNSDAMKFRRSRCPNSTRRRSLRRDR
jgi:hypothetical protein